MVAMIGRNGKCLLSKHNFSNPSSFKGLPFLSCMLWYVLVRSQIKFDTYLVEYLNRKCTEANQEQSTKKKKIKALSKHSELLAEELDGLNPHDSLRY